MSASKLNRSFLTTILSKQFTSASIFSLFCFFLFQFTRSHRGEKDKVPVQDDHDDSVSEVDEANLSLMDRTNLLAKSAREQQVVDNPVNARYVGLFSMLIGQVCSRLTC